MADPTPPTTGQTATAATPAVPATDTPLQGTATTVATATAPAVLTDEQLAKFEIPETVKQQFPDLVPLIIQTESMNDDERQYWFQILPIMTDEQVKKLREILLNAKGQLEKLDKEYQGEMKQINAKHESEWKEFEAKEKREKLKEAEGKSAVGEQATQEDLLKKLQSL